MNRTLAAALGLLFALGSASATPGDTPLPPPIPSGAGAGASSGSAGSVTNNAANGDVIVGGASTSAIKDSTTFGTNGGVSLSGGTVPTYGACFWNDTDTCTTINVRMRERVFIGNGVLMVDNQTLAEAGTFLSSSSVGANWIPRDAQLLSMADRGTIAIAGVSQNATTPGANADAIGVAGYAMNNTATTGKAWAAYFEAQFNPATVSGSSAFGIEVDCKNSSATNSTADPFTTGDGCYGIWVAGGGGTYGPATPNPANAAILIRNNQTAWNEGIVIQSGALSSGNHAIQLPNVYQLEWYTASANLSAAIKSAGSIANNSVTQLFRNNGVEFLTNASGAAGFTVFLQRGDTALANSSSVGVLDFVGNDNAGTPVSQTWARMSGVSNTTTGATANVGQFLIQTLSGSTIRTSMSIAPNFFTIATGPVNSATATALTITSTQQVEFSFAAVSIGTVPVGTTGSCVASSFAGGAIAGTFSAAVCTAGTIILSSMPTAPTGYSCSAWDRTTPADTVTQTASTTTSVTFKATTVAADVVQFACFGY
jgi:hypothetical protein